MMLPPVFAIYTLLLMPDVVYVIDAARDAAAICSTPAMSRRLAAAGTLINVRCCVRRGRAEAMRAVYVYAMLLRAKMVDGV